MSEEGKKPEKESNAFVEAGEDEQMGLVAEFIEFIRENKKYWMMPLLIILLGLGLLVLAAGSPLAPFIYTLF